MRAGKLRHSITIERPTTTKNTAGNAVETWATFAADVPADFAPLSAREFIAAGSMQSQVVARFTIRTIAGITADMRVLFDGLVYNIAGALPDPKSGQEWITLPVSAGVNAG